MRLSSIAFAGALGMMPPSAHGFVATANGNFFVGYTDIELSKDAAGIVPKVQRTYNSRSQFLGMFGYGWGNDFDTYLIPSADGSVIIQEGGGGDKTRFGSEKFNARELGSLIQGLVDAKTVKMSRDRLFDIEAYRARLMADAEFRDEEARQLDQTREPPVGLILFSSTRGKQSVTRLATGYVRDTGWGTKEFYEHKGHAYDQGVDTPSMRRINGVYRITKIQEDVSGKNTTFSYDESNGNLFRVSFADGNFFQFEYNSLGLVTKATSSLNETSTYRYCPSIQYDAKRRCQQADLISSTDSSRTSYDYAYDNLHNLVENGNSNQSKEAIEYWSGSASARGVKKVRSSVGRTDEYDYWVDPSDPELHYGTVVLTTYPSGGSYRTTYEYWMKRRTDGSAYRHRVVTRIGNDETETIYNECCEKPVKTTANGNITEIDYYPETGLIKERRSANQMASWEYSPKFGKITKFVSRDRAPGRTAEEYNFQYDDKGMLIVAAGPSGRRITLAYNSDQRISTVEDSDKNKLTFNYDAKGKPTRIALQGVGAITISYDATGVIQNVSSGDSNSPEGRKVAVKVAAIFQSLQELLKPAEVGI